ncbi:unnamed protein product [Albugo candida]|uniref:LRRNT domain-containing protein n=1 Tax=Albugo candida TaxID=65357 RepID=A0A024GH58_9STRA|nr:unnamed protein product [Albugo candida]|eukprot:CCI45682.1 unnamed protein product [Albugo candida]
MTFASIVSLLAAVLGHVEVVYSCPDVCKCIGSARVSVYCDFKGLSTIPDNIPMETTHLYLMGNQLTKIFPEMLQGTLRYSNNTFSRRKAALTQLKVIRLDLNPIERIDEFDFISVPSLKLVYLPFDIRILRHSFARAKLDGTAPHKFRRLDTHLLEDPHFVAFTTHSNQVSW